MFWMTVFYAVISSRHKFATTLSRLPDLVIPGTIDFMHDLIENIHRRSYEERIREVELSIFTPIVFSMSGGAGSTSCNSNDEKISITHCREERVVFQQCNELDKKPVLLLTD